MTLSLCMIVRNEEESLPKCLESVKDIVDEMIVVDTGSTDSTVKIAESYGAKVFYFEWNDNFSDARNFSLEQASGDWILVMDADDELEKEDKQKLLDLLKNDDVDAYFLETLSYVGSKPGLDVIMNLNIRLIRNHRGYKFSGAIHEQIASNIIDINKSAKIKVGKVRIYHYGYLDKSVIEKDKRRRNIKIIEKVLQDNPKDSFMLFNMGNEYFALGNYIKALEYYKKSYENFVLSAGYSSKLIIRMIMALSELGIHDEELKMIQEGLEYYPNFTDLEYLRGCLYHKQNKITLSIKSYKRCIELGEPPSYLNFIVGVGSYRAYHALSEIYFELEDYDEAYNYCIEALKSKPNFLMPFYRIAQILFKKKENVHTIKSRLEEFFGQNLDSFAYITLSDIFFGEGKYDIAYEYLVKAEALMDASPKILYYKGVCLLYLRQFKEANKYLKKIKIGEYYEKAIYNMILCEILDKNMNSAEKLLNRAREFENYHTRTVYKAFKNILENKNCTLISNDKEESKHYLNAIIDLLNILLKINEFDIFEKSLQLLNLIESDEVLLRLAKLYFINGYYNLAYQEFIRSIKIFDKIDTEGLEMMRNILCK